MNRPTRVPAPPETSYAEPDEAQFTEVAPPPARAQLPAVARQAAPAVTQAIPDYQGEEPEALAVTGFDKLAGAIASVMAEIKPVEKEGWNDFQKYNYARMQDLSRELTPLMGKHGIVVFQSEQRREMFDDGKAVAVTYLFTIVHKSGQIWPERIPQTGLSSCRNSKGGFDDKTLNKCHTSARKYFLLSLFQIPTDDAEDADEDAVHHDQRQRPRGARPVPAPNGKVGPHLVTIIDGEAPEAWAKRFKAFVDKAGDVPEVNKWYELNVAIFDKIQPRFLAVYNDLIDHMDAREASLTAPKTDPISSGPQAGSDFPGDKPRPAAAQDDGIPEALRRTKPALSDAERDWLESIENVFTAAEGAEELLEAKAQYMDPHKETVSKEAWKRATKALSTNTDRVAKNA